MYMSQNKNIYLSALLHDIGKFIERSKEYYKNTKKFENDFGVSREYAHRLYSAFFIDKFKHKDFLKDKSILKNVLFHHAADKTSKEFLNSDVSTKIVRIADDLSSAERTKTEFSQPKVNYDKARLLSIFSRIFNDKEPDGWKYYKTLVLKLDDSIFPYEELQTEGNDYRELVENFLNETKEIINEEQLLALLEKYTWAVPAQSPNKYNKNAIADISLFDHSRVTAAIANCIAIEYQNNNISKEDIFKYSQKKVDGNFIIEPEELANNPLFCLVQGDFSGIQNFIFDVDSKKAAKSLKARSFYLQVLSEVISKYLIEQLELKEVNILYNGGGNFYLLIPKSLETKLKEHHKHITQTLLKAHHGQIYLAIGSIDLSMNNFKDFGEEWKQVADETAKNKHNRFKEIEYKDVFEAFEVEEKKYETKFYSSFQDFSDKVKNAKFISYQKLSKIDNISVFKSCYDVFKAFGYDVSFSNNENFNQTYKLNKTDFKKYTGFKFAVNKIDYADFTDIAKTSKGDKKLAVLKMDVDNLGKIFQKGIKEGERTISRIATLSRSFALFFEGYINTIIDKQNYLYNNKRLIYVVYSGGDDTLIVGPFDKIIELALDIRKKFEEYVCNNPSITLSAAITVIDDKFPILHAVEIAEDQLSKAKHKDEKKNKISVFDEIFTWNEYEKILEIQKKLVQLIDNKDTSKKESRAILQKILNSTKGFKKLMEDSANKNILDFQKIWRFSYYLRTMKTDNKTEKEELVKIYEDILLKNTIDGLEIKNIMILPAACRFAELLTKK